MAWISVEPEPGLKILLGATGRGLCRLHLGDTAEPAGERDDSHPVLRSAIEQLAEYFRGQRREFQLPLDLSGTPFQQKVWHALLRIPYGETRSYAELAAEIGQPKAVRAVARANGANPVAIIVPCHRVIAADGGLCGYGGGLEMKRRLLLLEGAITASSGAPSRSASQSGRAVAPDCQPRLLF